MSKVSIQLTPEYFHTFKDIVHKEFPHWQVKAFAPRVYVIQNGDQVNVFSIVGVEITPADLERLQAIADRIELIPPADQTTNFKFDLSSTGPRRYKAKVPIKIGLGKAFRGVR